MRVKYLLIEIIYEIAGSLQDLHGSRFIDDYYFNKKNYLNPRVDAIIRDYLDSPNRLDNLKLIVQLLIVSVKNTANESIHTYFDTISAISRGVDGGGIPYTIQEKMIMINSHLRPLIQNMVDCFSLTKTSSLTATEFKDFNTSVSSTQNPFYPRFSGIINGWYADLSTLISEDFNRYMLIDQQDV